MLDAELDPETYSRYVSVPEQKQNLVGMKIEMRVELEQEVDGQMEDFVHCFEGEITATDEPNDRSAVCCAWDEDKVGGCVGCRVH